VLMAREPIGGRGRVAVVELLVRMLEQGGAGRDRGGGLRVRRGGSRSGRGRRRSRGRRAAAASEQERETGSESESHFSLLPLRRTAGRPPTARSCGTRVDPTVFAREGRPWPGPADI